MTELGYRRTEGRELIEDALIQARALLTTIEREFIGAGQPMKANLCRFKINLLTAALKEYYDRARC
jgi:hypothetical protein